MVTALTTLLVIIALLQLPQIVVLFLLVPAIRDHHAHAPRHAKGRTMTAQPAWDQVEPNHDHTLGFLIRRWIRGRYRYLRVRDERDAADRSGDYE